MTKLKMKQITKHKLFDNIFVLYLLTLLLLVLGQILGGLLLFFPFMGNTDVTLTAYMYASFIGIWIVALLYMRFTKKNRPILRVLGSHGSGNSFKTFLLGLLLGFGLNGVCILAAWLHKDISLYYDSFKPFGVIVIFLAVFIQSSAEELLCRGFLYQRLRRSYRHPAAAIVGCSLFFAIMHLTNDGVTFLSICNIFIVGIFFSLLVFYLDSLWCAMALHTAWNFSQSIIFGLPNSGVVVPYSVFHLDASTAANSFAYNVGFGIEGTLFTDIVLILACIGMYLWGKRYGRKPVDVWTS